MPISILIFLLVIILILIICNIVINSLQLNNAISGGSNKKYFGSNKKYFGGTILNAENLLKYISDNVDSASRDKKYEQIKAATIKWIKNNYQKELGEEIDFPLLLTYIVSGIYSISGINRNSNIEEQQANLEKCKNNINILLKEMIGTNYPINDLSSSNSSSNSSRSESDSTFNLEVDLNPLSENKSSEKRVFDVNLLSENKSSEKRVFDVNLLSENDSENDSTFNLKVDLNPLSGDEFNRSNQKVRNFYKKEIFSNSDKSSDSDGSSNLYRSSNSYRSKNLAKFSNSANSSNLTNSSNLSGLLRLGESKAKLNQNYANQLKKVLDMKTQNEKKNWDNIKLYIEDIKFPEELYIEE